jgi:RimJ/RimL family protein N-acetyltransferase
VYPRPGVSGAVTPARRAPASARDEAAPLHWQPREPPLIVVDGSFVLDRWRPADGPALRRFDLDPRYRTVLRLLDRAGRGAARQPLRRPHAGTRSLQAWREGKQLNLAIRRSSDGEAVGWVELRRAGEQAEVSYNVTAELRGQGIAPRVLSALLASMKSAANPSRALRSAHLRRADPQSRVLGLSRRSVVPTRRTGRCYAWHRPRSR